MYNPTTAEAAYTEEHLRYRKLLGMGCDVMLTQEQAHEVSKLLGTAHVAMQHNAMLRDDNRYWQHKHVEALNKCAQLTRVLELANDFIKGLSPENEDNQRRMEVNEQCPSQEASGQGASKIEVCDALRKV